MDSSDLLGGTRHRLGVDPDPRSLPALRDPPEDEALAAYRVVADCLDALLELQIERWRTLAPRLAAHAQRIREQLHRYRQDIPPETIEPD